MVIPQGVQTDSVKTETIQSWETPTSAEQAQRFLRLVYRQFHPILQK